MQSFCLKTNVNAIAFGLVIYGGIFLFRIVLSVGYKFKLTI